MDAPALSAIRAVDWSSLEDAFGSAEDYPDVVADYARTGDVAAIDDLVERSAHQGFRSATAAPLLDVLCALARENDAQFVDLAEPIVTLALGDPFASLPTLHFAPDATNPPKRLLESAIDATTATRCFSAGGRFASDALLRCHDASAAVRMAGYYGSFWFHAASAAYQASLQRALEAASDADEQRFCVVAMSLLPTATSEATRYPERVAAIAELLGLPTPDDSPLDSPRHRDALGRRYRFPWFEGCLAVPCILAGLRRPAELPRRLALALEVFAADPFRIRDIV